jgi:hypothetical protein
MAVPVSPYRVKEKSGWAIADPPRVRRRVLICLAVLCFAFTGLLVRLWYLQVVRGEAYLLQAQNNRPRKRAAFGAARPHPRPQQQNPGDLARHAFRCGCAGGFALARRDPVGRAKVLRTLGFIIHVSPQEIEKQIEEAQRRGGRLYDPVRVGGPLDLKTITLSKKTKRASGPTGAVLVTNDIKRFYPRRSDKRAHPGLQRCCYSRRTSRSRSAPWQAGQDVRALSYDDIVGKIGMSASMIEYSPAPW